MDLDFLDDLLIESEEKIPQLKDDDMLLNLLSDEDVYISTNTLNYIGGV